VVLDLDTGIDDALALLLALNSPELDIVGITCVAGNVTLDLVVRNTLAVLELMGSRLPVAVGARKPLVSPLRTATFFHGKNGLGNVELPSPQGRPVEQDATSFLTGAVRDAPGEITVIAVGPLTNLALAVLRDPEFASQAARFVLMGGAISAPGNASGAAEANISNDPEAARAVVESGALIQLVDLGATMPTVLPVPVIEEAAERELGPVADFAVKLLQYYMQACVAAGSSGAVLHDPLAVGLTALPELATFVPIHLAVETAGRYTRGATIGRFARVSSREEWVGDHRDVVGLEPVEFNASVPRQIDVARFVELFQERLGILP
jgi:purine nucleosidase